MFKTLRTAVGFLTILPVSPKQIEPTDMGRAVALFPLVGVIYAVVAWGSLKLFNYVFSATIAAWLTVFLITVLNGSIHWDGFIDTADGLGGRTPEQSRAIMKDSRMGAFGGIALGFLIIGKIILLKSLTYHSLGILVGVFSISRWAMAFQIYTQPSVSEGLLKNFQITDRRSGLLTASGLALLMIVWAFPVGFVLIGLASLTLLLINQLVRRKFGGITGDILGATNELVELICLLFLNLKIAWF